MSFTLQRGTIGFAAPEVLGFNYNANIADEEIHYSGEESAKMHSYIHSADMWSLGAMVYLMLTESPFLNANVNLILKFADGKRRFPSELLQTNKVTKQGQEFIHQLMSPNPMDRPTAAQAVGHEWCSLPLAENWHVQVM